MKVVTLLFKNLSHLGDNGDNMSIDLLPWILIVQLWSDPPPKIKFVYSKVYPDYAACMDARKEWEQKNFVALCSPKSENKPK